VSYSIVKYKDWEFEVDIPLTQQAYSNFPFGGADTCSCADCKNYAANRETVFPAEIIQLFNELGIDYRKEIEIWSIQKLENGLHQISGWFHFKGKIISGKDFRMPFAEGIGYSMDLTSITEKFKIGFAPGNSLTFFDNKKDLIQIEFIAEIPWVIDKKDETD
jgi:hypothetical protein